MTTDTPRYEYKLLYFRLGVRQPGGFPAGLNERFDELGADGWEYVDLKPVQTGGFFFGIVGIFSSTKRFLVVFRRVR